MAASHRSKRRAPSNRKCVLRIDRNEVSPRAIVLKELEALTKDKDRLEALLRLEKARRGLQESALCFVGAHNVAQLTWCPMFAVLKSRQNELSLFFASYLENRVHAASALKGVETLPTSDAEWLSIGADIKLAEYERYCHMRYEQGAPERERRRHKQERNKEFVDRLLARYPEFRAEVASETPESLEDELAEKHFRMRWHFEWKEFVIITSPDGLTDEFVYEFKTHQRRRFLRDDLRNAFAQADIYGLCFGRTHKRVQIFTREDRKSETTTLPVDAANANSILERFKIVVDTTASPAQPDWKCGGCEFKDACPIRNTSLARLKRVEPPAIGS